MKKNLLVLLGIITLSFDYLKSLIAPTQITPNIPLSVCDQRYAIEMQQTLDALRGTFDAESLKTAQEYMVMVKQNNDLQLKIQELERVKFNLTQTALLRTPLARYFECFTSVTNPNRGTPPTTVLP